MNAGSPDLSLRAAAAALRAGDLDPVALVRAALARIDATEPVLRAWVVVDRVGAEAAAAEAAIELRRGHDRGPLHGIPVAIKDIIDVAGLPTRCGSTVRAETPPAAADAPVVARLRRAGAIILGKTVTQEYAAGVLSPPARNPWDPARSPGGSSGGSAVAVAVGAAMVALGSDTGGSIRIPAAVCGVAGFKPAYGALPMTGIAPLAPSLDTAGPLARTVDDLEIGWRVLSGDERPSLPARDLGGVRLGVPRGWFWDRLQPGVAAAMEGALGVFADLGAALVEADWPDAKAARAAAFVTNRIETAASVWPETNGDPTLLARLNPDLRLRVVGGRLLPGALAEEARAVRERSRASIAAYLAAHRLDAVVAPTVPAVAVPADDPVARYADAIEPAAAGHTRLTMPFNATGQPVLAVPAGFDADGLPVGLQLAGQAGNEPRLFAIGRAYEATAGWAAVSPSLGKQRR